MRKTLIPVLLALGLLLSATARAQENAEPILLEASVIVAQPPLVKTVGDTVVFNPGALNIEEDATLEDLLRKIPGLEVEGGTVTMYGRKVEKLLVGGRLYFGGDVLAGLKNIQGDEVEEIRSYERPSEFTRLSGVDDGEAAPVLDIRIKKKFMGTWKGRLQGGGSYPLRYTAAVNGGFITDSTQLSAIANLRNRPAPPTIPTTSLTRLGNGAEGVQDHREAGVDYSINGKKRDVSANVKYTGSAYDRHRDGWSRSIYTSGSTYSLSDVEQRGRNDKLQAQGEWELKPDKHNTFFIKPLFTWTGSGSWSAPVSNTYNSNPRTDGEATPVNTIKQPSATLQDKLDGQFTFQYTHRFPKKGRTGSLRLVEKASGGWNHTFNDYSALTLKNGKTTVRKQYVRSPWVRNDLYAQGSWSEPFGKGFYLQLLLQARVVWHGIDRDFHSMESLGGIDAWTAAPLLRLGEQLARLPDGWASALDPDLSSDGTYTGVLLTASANLRFVRKKFNTTVGVALKPVWSFVRYSTTGLEDQRTRSFNFYAAPNLTLRYNKSKTEFLAVNYRSDVSTPPPTSLIPIRSGTNPLYVRIGNPDLKPSFNHRLKLTYNYSDPGKGSSIVLEADGRYVQNAFATSTEYIPETGGRQIRSCNIGGNGGANASLTVNHTFRGTPLSLVNHFNGAFVNDAAYMYNNVSHEDEVSIMQRFSVRERIELTARWQKFAVTVQGGGEYAYERSLLRPEMKQSPYALYAGTDFSWTLPRRWRIAADFGFYASRGHGFEELDRNLYMLNASISKGLGKGMTLRLSGGDLLNQNTHITYRFGASNQQLFLYNGLGRSVLLQFICRFPTAKSTP